MFGDGGNGGLLQSRRIEELRLRGPSQLCQGSDGGDRLRVLRRVRQACTDEFKLIGTELSRAVEQPTQADMADKTGWMAKLDQERPRRAGHPRIAARDSL